MGCNVHISTPLYHAVCNHGKKHYFMFSDFFGEFLMTLVPKKGVQVPDDEKPIYLLDRGLAEKVGSFLQK